MNRFLRMSICVAVVLLTGTVLTLVAFLVPHMVHRLIGPVSGPRPKWIPAAITLLAWFGIQFAAALGERCARRLGLEPRGREPAPGLLRSIVALGAGMVAGAIVVIPTLTMSGRTMRAAGILAMGAAGTVGFLWARAVLRGGLFAPPPAERPGADPETRDTR